MLFTKKDLSRFVKIFQYSIEILPIINSIPFLRLFDYTTNLSIFY